MSANTEPKFRVPCAKTFEQVARIAISQDRPIMLDYWLGSIDKSVFIGVVSENEKMLVRNQNEYTSPIKNIYSVRYMDGDVERKDFIILTEHSIYIVDENIPRRQCGPMNN